MRQYFGVVAEGKSKAGSIVHGFLTDSGVIASRGEPVEGEKWFVVNPEGTLCSGPYPDGFPTQAEAMLWAQGGNAA